MRSLLLVCMIFWLFSCQKSAIETKSFTLEKPSYFPDVTYPLYNNPLTEAGFDLGKKIFNDPILSIDQSVACSNCHTQSLAFTDAQHHPSVGVGERVGVRDAPPIMNLAFRRTFFWDGSVDQLDFVPLAAIEHPSEMGETLGGVVQKMNNHKEYPSQFLRVFPTMDTITGPLVLKAVAQYLLALVSADSRYDQFVRGELNLSPQELAGLKVFEDKCQSCHIPPLFTNEEFVNTGLDLWSHDPGRAGVTDSDRDRGKFIVPSLRNITLTAPYMHDGRFQTLSEVLDFYEKDVQSADNLAPELKTETGLGFTFTHSEKEDLIAFLSTLTDFNFITNPKF